MSVCRVRVNFGGEEEEERGGQLFLFFVWTQ